MYYSPLVKKASRLLFEAHGSDLDKGGYPYVMHPLYLAFQMEDEDAVCVALLHDLIEDHGDKYSIEYLAREGFGEKILSALRLLTHDPSVPYMDYVREIGKDPLARRVKIADLRHNSDASRLEGQTPKKADLYREALLYLTSLDH